MYDTLCRHFIPTYGNEWVKAPNFERLAKRSVQFNNFYVGSMPCMPARREMHTGRYNFLHRSWGPLEPFDDSMPSILHRNGVHSHKVTDHHHYWEDGGATYHQRYTTFGDLGRMGRFQETLRSATAIHSGRNSVATAQCGGMLGSEKIVNGNTNIFL